MEELPESCISQILSFTTPRDVCRLSALSHTFMWAGNSDSVWEKMLPVQYRHLLARLDSPLQFSSMRELYFTLCHPNSIDGRAKEFWIEQATGKLCFMLSARDLNITRGDDRRYWHWISEGGPSFKEIAEQVAVSGLEVQGQFDCEFLSPGTAYTVSFRLKLHKLPHRIGRRRFICICGRTDGWDHRPVKFSVTTPCGDHQECAQYLRNTDMPVGNEGYQMTLYRNVEKDWMEVDAGRFVVPEHGDNSGIIKFCMEEWEGGNWKSRLLLGGVKIQPTSLTNERTNANQE